MPDTLQIQWLDADRVKPYPDNPRRRSDAEIEKIMASIRAYGWRQPIVTDKDFVVIVGHGRLLAGQRLIAAADPAYLQQYGRTVPVDVADGLSPEQVRAYRIADNRIHQDSEWETTLLVKELGELRDVDFEMGLTGFSDEELRGLLGLVEQTAYPEMADGDKEPFQMIHFTLHDAQAAVVIAALARAKAEGPFADGLNENANGNALARVCERYLAFVKAEAEQHA